MMVPGTVSPEWGTTLYNGRGRLSPFALEARGEWNGLLQLSSRESLYDGTDYAIALAAVQADSEGGGRVSIGRREL